MKFKIAITLIICLNLIFCASPQKKIKQERENDPRYQYNLGLYYLNNSQFDEAIKYLSKCMELDPQHFLALNALGQANWMKGRLEVSVSYFQKCLEINPAFTEAHNNLGVSHQEMGFLDKAEQEFRRATADKNYGSRELPYYNLAKLYFEKGKLPEALDFVKKSIEINRTMSIAYNLMGTIYEKLENYEEAIQSYKQALKLSPDDINISFNLASAYFKNNEFQKAKDIFNQIYIQITDSEMKEKIEKYLKLIKDKSLDK